MEYHGFRSVKEYENECARVGFTTRRVPFHKGNKPYFVLITTPPGHPTGASVESWTLFTADETAVILDGVLRGGTPGSLPDLSSHGYQPDAPEEADETAAPALSLYLETAEDGAGLPQFSLLPL